VSPVHNNKRFHLAFDKHNTNLSFTRNQNVEYVSVQQPGVFHQQQLLQQPQIVYVAVPQQQIQQIYDPKLGIPVQVAMQQVVQPGQIVYQTSTPLTLLNRYPSPVDCPACGQRSITRIAYITGNATQ
jgi:lipopolysaccharide-induced tumor necrosis factor-alpha factor